MAFARQADDTINAALTAEVETLDIYRNTVRESGIIVRYIQGFLLTKDLKTGHFKFIAVRGLSIPLPKVLTINDHH